MEQIETPIAATTSAKCDESAGGGLSDFVDYWNCQDLIYINVSALPTSPTNLRTSATNAVNDWNNALRAQALELPVLTTTAGGQNYTINVTFSAAGQYCGAVNGSPKPNNINMAPGNCGPFREVFLHELAHVYGFGDNWEHWGTTNFSNHCARFVPGGGVMNGAVCQHEVESLHRHYGIRSGPEVPLNKHVMTSFNGLPLTLSMPAGNTQSLGVTGFVFNRVHPSFCGSEGCDPVAPSGNAVWDETSPAISVTGTNQFIKTVTGTAVGTGTITVRYTGTTYAVAGYFTGDTTRVTVTAPPAPTGLSASNITRTSATVSWTPGDAAATTVVRYRLTGQTGWTTGNGGNPVPAGQTSLNLTGLHCATSYDVSVHHVKNGVTGPALVLTLFSTSACQSGSVTAPSGFTLTDCTPSTSSGKQYATYHLAWTAGSNPSGTIYHIGSAFSNNSGSAAVIHTGPINQTTDDVGPYLVAPASSDRYFWVRHVNGANASAWVALQGNPIEISDGCSN